MKLTPDVVIRAIHAQSVAVGSVAVGSVAVGFSGGVDSTALLYICKILRDRGDIKTLRAIHVHHGLSPLADGWVDHARALCRNWDIPLSVHHVGFDDTSNVEEAAREARYQVFESELHDGGVLLQGHHLDDQVETIMYRVMRGTGVAGLQGIPVSRPLGKGQIVRPLLGCERKDIEAYAGEKHLEWIEDESNTDIRFDRNFLRNNVIPELVERWPGMKIGLARLAELSSEAEEILQGVADEDYGRCVVGCDVPVLGEAQLLDIHTLEALPVSRRSLLLREWLRREKLSVPSRATLLQVMEEVSGARVDGEPVVVWAGGEVRRYKHFLVACQPVKKTVAFKSILYKGESLTLPDQSRVECKGVTASSVKHGQVCVSAGAFGVFSVRSEIDVQPFSLPGRKGSKSLKKWLNEIGVPSWLRDRLPIFHDGDQLIAIPGLLVADGYQVEAGDPGISMNWLS